ncbi:HAD family hydrolase [Sphingobacterium chungjuense]|uniref:HAD family hydrolase n=1 Tax=Sphingobacterium chungjuense TaxID=2675553 RepID=UPI00140E4DCE|nr:HAD family hydrolase [Sphingobacterium chungjuense]
MNNTIKGLLFDFGGTLDSKGDHWSTILWDLYVRLEINVTQEAFYQAYVHTERKAALERIILPDFNMEQVLLAKVAAQFEFLKTLNYRLDDDLITPIASGGYDFAKYHIAKAKTVLSLLANKIPMVMVSNFYGNLRAVLEDYKIDHFFDHVIESAVVGVRKPDPQIYSLGIEAIKLSPAECLVIGDSLSKDIEPGNNCGCQTAWLKGNSLEHDIDSDVKPTYTISDINEVLDIVFEDADLSTKK